MAFSRFVFHPILQNKRSRIIFSWYLVLAISIGVYSWLQVDQILKESGVVFSPNVQPSNPLVGYLLAGYVRIALIFLSTVIAGGITAKHVVGPVRRIEQWVRDWKSGHNIDDLRVRNKDKFEKLVFYLNELHNKYSSPKK